MRLRKKSASVLSAPAAAFSTTSRGVKELSSFSMCGITGALHSMAKNSPVDTSQKAMPPLLPRTQMAQT